MTFASGIPSDVKWIIEIQMDKNQMIVCFACSFCLMQRLVTYCGKTQVQLEEVLQSLGNNETIFPANSRHA